ncbi:hypothetical protein IHE45_14G011000 [Dioscorea alata]|uniref:Uncharacterized protein n=4 Tax=Dioscorea alata TaxID=55571 RepID=A0ACB7UQ12_DIOAL|nr:hypothetical protein IHE45_14G011000 [Dioscorea alata]KAH7662784.1 hypothetical protein IHE45_14G011000 [Dioscorea alata]KAH7662785.1 hypothetical protein IHE45_14G011000 [Dioscorea alata]KAH7662786.1 hypothetical protein IHE45_14G011000 [Dioscorea alata]
MNEYQKRRQMQSQQQFPGCMGSLINMFDLSSGMYRTKLLTDRAHRDDSPTRTNKSSVVKKSLEPVGIQIRDKPMINEMKKSFSDKKSCGTPMKMLIAQEMSKEIESNRKPPSVVAKLMGLDTMPVPTRQRSIRESSSYKDVYEVRQQPSQASCVNDQQQQRGKLNEHSNQKKMALVRQKFTEAKRLATDKSFLHSKQFQEALEVLSSNQDLFLKFLDEPNSLLSKHLNQINTTTSSGQVRHITVLKPSNAVEPKVQHRAFEENIRNKDNHRRCSSLDHFETRNLSSPTRIVVLKPSTAKPCEFKTLAANRIFSQKLLKEKGLDNDLNSMNSNRRDDSLLSSMLSNGYIGDESSFNRSEIEYVEEASGDSEIVTPTSRHSWDYTNRLGSPYSLGRASCSSESSVICEAKKRISERWASVASKGVSQEHMQVRSSSTLGEMLAIAEAKKEGESSRELDLSSNQSFGEDDDPRTSTTCVSITETKDGANAETSSRNFSRSKSVPVTSSTYDKIELNAAASKPRIIKPNAHEEEMKPKSGKMSLKGKVSSFFFSKNKKPSQEKLIPEIGAKKDHGPEETNSSLPSATVAGGSKNSIVSAKAVPSLEKFSVSETPTETLEQPSPVSVLEAPFDDESGISLLQSSHSLDTGNLQTLSRSAPIESIARSLPWDDTYMERSSGKSLKLTEAAFKVDEEEQEHFNFVQKLLSSAGLDDQSSKIIFSKWHSLDCPLDRVSLDGFFDEKEEGIKYKVNRSNQRLLFDCVNAALLEIGQAAIYNAYPHARSFAETRKDVPSGTSGAEVWKLVRDKFSAQEEYSSETGNNNVLIDQVVKKEVCGSEWTELLWWELNEFSKEISKKVLEELIRETLSDLTVPCLC